MGDHVIYYGATELAASFRTVRKNTLVIAHEIPEEHYAFRAAEGTRTVAQLFAHISVACTLQYRLHGVEGRNSFDGFDLKALITSVLAEESKFRTKNEIVAMLVQSGEQWADCVAGLSEEFLASRVQFPAGAEPPSKTRFEMILSVKEHEMHHRAQLMIVERMLGIVPHLTRALEQSIRELNK
jgi:uncharacterized damage-inducible protein DinB